MNFHQLRLRLFSTRTDFIETANGNFRIYFPDYFWIRRKNSSIEILDFLDRNFFLEISFLFNNDKENIQLEKEFDKIKNENPNAELQSTGKYECICSATITEDKKTICYQWTIIHKNKVALATFTTKGSDARETIDNRIYTVGEILKGLDIND